MAQHDNCLCTGEIFWNDKTVNQCDALHSMLRSQQNGMNTWKPFCMVIITRILMHFKVFKN